MSELAETLRHDCGPRLRPRELDWAYCDECGSSFALARATEEGEVHDHTPGICLECGAVLCADVDGTMDEGEMVSWVVTILDTIEWEPVRVRPLTLAAARRVAGWPRESWWSVCPHG